MIVAWRATGLTDKTGLGAKPRSAAYSPAYCRPLGFEPSDRKAVGCVSTVTSALVGRSGRYRAVAAPLLRDTVRDMSSVNISRNVPDRRDSHAQALGGSRGGSVRASAVQSRC